MTSSPNGEAEPWSIPFPELEERTFAEHQSDMAAGRVTARTLAEQYLARIAATNRRGPHLRAIIETNPDALTIADGLDGERRAGKVRGPLHGVPIVIKDNIATADRMATTAGSLALLGTKPQEAFVVQRLRAAGAIVLAKA